LKRFLPLSYDIIIRFISEEVTPYFESFFKKAEGAGYREIGPPRVLAYVTLDSFVTQKANPKIPSAGLKAEAKNHTQGIKSNMGLHQ
jgi:hypothetical protein